MKKLLIANRGEIAIRIGQSAAEYGLRTVAIFPEDDARSLHRIHADESQQLPGIGAEAYLNIEAVIQAAKDSKADAVHPGYGFLSENPAFAAACEAADLVFVGPSPAQLSALGNKTSARALAAECNVPLVPGSSGDTSLEAVLAFQDTLARARNGDDGIVIKAIHGGGGRGMRILEAGDDITKIYARCRSEAQLAFGNDAVYVEALINKARHIEVQIIGDAQGKVAHLWERDCSIQRQNRKLVEIAPCPNLPKKTRNNLLAASVKMAKSILYRGLGTFEFLLDLEQQDTFYFIEANPRLQVEHSVTEVITGLDLVQLQLGIAEGKSLKELGLSARIPRRGYAVQARINLERLNKKGIFKPSSGLIDVFEPPSGPGIRTDSYGYAGYKTSTRYDPLLAKLIVQADDFAAAVQKTRRALRQFRLEGLEVNIPFLITLLGEETLLRGEVWTRYIDQQLPALAEKTIQDQDTAIPGQTEASQEVPKSGQAGTRLSSTDPLAVLNHGRSASSDPGTLAGSALPTLVQGPAGSHPVPAPLQGTIIELSVAKGDLVHTGQALLVMDAMKMEHVIKTPLSGEVVGVTVAVGDAILEDHPLVFIEEKLVASTEQTNHATPDLDYIRPDLAEAMTRHGYKLDKNRAIKVAKRHKTGHRTARENIHDLCDPGSFIEYGSLAIAAQRRRKPIQELMETTPGDGMVTGIGSVNQTLFPDQTTRCLVMSYDYMVLAGTQGLQNHRKKDRIFELARRLRLPIILIAEGGGGRPGDTDGAGIAGLDCLAFQLYGSLSGLVPRIGITTGRCFAGNAVLLGSSDLVIATLDANIGIGGPAMIEGGGLGTFKPEEVGPMAVQVPNGVVDIAVTDEAEAIATAKKLLAFFQGSLENWTCQDQRQLRARVPENRRRVYDMREIIRLIADDDSVLEIRPAFGIGIITSLIRVEGRSLGVFANNPAHLSGAIDSDAADKAARFMQLCDAFDIPLLSLVDCPGIMVGPEIEKTALVRHASRLFVIGTNLKVPLLAVVVRKGYGLGAQAMTGGGFKASTFTIAWPTGEFGGMGLEGAVKLGFRKELKAIADPEARRREYEERVAAMYERGKAVNFATAFEIDEVIDPANTRHWIISALASSPAPPPREGKKNPFIDTW